MNYEHQMAMAVIQLLQDEDEDLTRFNANDLMNFVENNSSTLGQIIVENMINFASNESWLDTVEENL